MMYKVQVRFLFHSDIKIKIPEIYDDSIFDKLFGILEDIDEKYNSYSENSYIDKINKNSGHIISPKTGFPSQNKQVGVITENAFFSDIISTGLYNQTPCKFYEIMVKLSKEMEVSGFLINKAGKIFYFNMGKYF